jgi:hypothetical protein
MWLCACASFRVTVRAYLHFPTHIHTHTHTHTHRDSTVSREHSSVGGPMHMVRAWTAANADQPGHAGSGNFGLLQRDPALPGVVHLLFQMDSLSDPHAGYPRGRARSAVEEGWCCVFVTGFSRAGVGFCAVVPSAVALLYRSRVARPVRWRQIRRTVGLRSRSSGPRSVGEFVN